MNEVSDAQLAEQAMNRRFTLSDDIALAQGRHKAELEPLLEEQKLCETYVKDFMNTGNMQQYKVLSGDQAYFQTGTRAGVSEFEQVLDFIVAAPALPGFEEHWDTIKQHIRAEGNWNLLNRAVNKTAVSEHVEANNGAPPPGVKYETYRDLQWRKGKG